MVAVWLVNPPLVTQTPHMGTGSCPSCSKTAVSSRDLAKTEKDA